MKETDCCSCEKVKGYQDLEILQNITKKGFGTLERSRYVNWDIFDASYSKLTIIISKTLPMFRQEKNYKDELCRVDTK